MADLARKTALLLVALSVSLVAGDLVFRWYEERFLTISLDPTGPVIDLARLNYNETEVPRARPPGQLRILGFGDSYAYSVVKRAYTYHTVAQRLLEEHGANVRIVNLGEPAISFHRYANAYEHWAARIEHDAVVFNVFIGNDFTDANRAESEQDGVLNRVFGGMDFNMETGRRRMVNVPRKFPLRMLDYAYASYRSAFGPGAGRDHAKRAADRGPYNLALVIRGADWILAHNRRQLVNFDVERLPELSRGWAAFADLVEVASHARRSGKRVLFMLAPNETQAIPSVPPELARRFGVELDRYDLRLPNFLARETIRRIDPELAVMDLNESLLCASREGRVVYHPENPHWSVEGNQLAGEKLARFVAQHWLAEDPGLDDALQPCVRELATLGEPLPADPRRRRAQREFLDPLLDGRG